MFVLLLLLSVACPIAAAAKEKKGPDISLQEEVQRKDKLTKEEIMFGNQQNIPSSKTGGALDRAGKVANVNLTADSQKMSAKIDGLKGDPGSATPDTPKLDYYDYLDGDSSPGENSYVIFAPGEDDEDYQYDEPYALYRRRRDVKRQRRGRIQAGRSDQRKNEHAIRKVARAKRSTDDLFNDIEGVSEGSVFDENQNPEFYQYMGEEPKLPFEKFFSEEMPPDIAKELYPGWLIDQVPQQVIDINRDGAFKNPYGSTLPIWNPKPHPKYLVDGPPKWEEPDKIGPEILEKEDAERLLELALLLQAASEKGRQKK